MCLWACLRQLCARSSAVPPDTELHTYSEPVHQHIDETHGHGTVNSSINEHLLRPETPVSVGPNSSINGSLATYHGNDGRPASRRSRQAAEPAVPDQSLTSDVDADLDTGIKRASSMGVSGIKLLLNFLKEQGDAFPPLKAVVGGVLAILDMYEVMASNKETMDDTTAQLDRLLGILARHMDRSRDAQSFDPSLYAKSLSERLAVVENMSRDGWFKRAVGGTQDKQELDAICKDITNTIRELQLEIGLSTEKRTETILQSTILQNLKRAGAAAYTAAVSAEISRRSCTEGTRSTIISQLMAWALDETEDARPVYWISGLAGQGKTTIAHTICEQLQEVAKDISVVSFFCSRQLDSGKEQLLVSTLALELAQVSASYASLLVHALQANPKLGTQRLNVQFPQLLATPWHTSAPSREGLRPVIVVIDALDENEAGVDFLELILSQSHGGKLPGLRVLLTSRPEPSMKQLCENADARTVMSSCHLNDVSRNTVDKDIMRYLEAELPNHRDGEYLKNVADASAGIFIYASTVVRMVKGRRRTHDEQARALQKLANPASAGTYLGDDHATVLDELYKKVVDDAFRGLHPSEKETRERILLTATCTSESMHLDLLGFLAQASEDLARVAVESLHPVLYLDKDGAVLWYHASFQDFILATGMYQSYVVPIRAKTASRCETILATLEHLDGLPNYSKNCICSDLASMRNSGRTDPEWPTQHVDGAIGPTKDHLYDAHERDLLASWHGGMHGFLLSLDGDPGESVAPTGDGKTFEGDSV